MKRESSCAVSLPSAPPLIGWRVDLAVGAVLVLYAAVGVALYFAQRG